MNTPTVQRNVRLASHTAFGVGGIAELYAEVTNSEQLVELLKEHQPDQLWLLGYGSNTLISDKGLPGLTVVINGGDLQFSDDQVVVDAGVWWDDVVQASIERGLWGLELMSAIPGSVGAALFINITAYGQSIGSRVVWVEVWDPVAKSTRRLTADELTWGYKQSFFQQPEHQQLVILRACLQLSDTKTEDLTYQKALDVASERGLDIDNLADRRDIIVEARRRAGSLWSPDDKDAARTVGSFFRNPIVSAEQAEQLMAFDESGKTAEQIKNMNRVHGGSEQRVSAAHVMLAAGFKRGDRWGAVQLNDQNLLKIEALDGATAQDIYNVMKHIQNVCQDKLSITLEPEARLLGEF